METQHDEDGFLLPEKHSQAIEKTHTNTENILKIITPKTRVEAAQRPISTTTPARITPYQKRAERSRVLNDKHNKIQTEALETIAKNTHPTAAKRDSNGRFLSKQSSSFGKFWKWGKLGKLGKVGMLGLLAALAGIFSVEGLNISRGDKNKKHAKNAALGLGGLGGAMLGATVGSVIPVIGTTIGAILGGIGGAVLVDKFTDWLDDLIDPNISKKMFASWDNFVIGMKHLGRSLFGKFTQLGEQFFALLPESWQVHLGAIGQMAQNTWEAFSDNITPYFDHIKTTAGDAWENFTVGITLYFDHIKTTASDAWKNFAGSIAPYFDYIKTTAIDAWKNFTGSIAPYFEYLKNIANRLFGGIAKTFGEKWEQYGEPIVQAAQTKIENGINTVKEVSSHIKQEYQDNVAARQEAIQIQQQSTNAHEVIVTGGKQATQDDSLRLQNELSRNKLIRSNEAVSGGVTHAGTFAAALDFRGVMGNDLKYFSAFNDGYHHRKNPNSMHTKGLALDIVNQSGSLEKARTQAENLYRQLTAMGFKGRLATAKNGKRINIGSGQDFFIQDEYNRPSKNSTGGHIHFNWGSEDVAQRYFAMTRGGAKVQIVEKQPEKGWLQSTKDVAQNVLNHVIPSANAANFPVVSPQANDRLMQLKSLIAGKESVRKGWDSYDVGNKKQGDRIVYSEHKLSQMTLEQVMQAQQNGSLFAAGKYQIIPTTLQDAVHKMKLDKKQKFDAQMQEKLGDYLLLEKRKAIKHYIETGEGFDQAALEMAKEWASIPVLKDITNHKGVLRKRGQSYYANRFDKAHHTPEHIETALKAARHNFVQAQNKPIQMASIQNVKTPPVSMPNPTVAAPQVAQAVVSERMNVMQLTHKPVSRTVDNAQIAHMTSGGIMQHHG